MTRLPSQSEVDVHWRAVLSLREIWTEERQRMARLLPPKDNFLSGESKNDDLSFTLSVKKGAPIPGSRLAFHGNRRLFDSSPTLENDFRRAMTDILKKYESIFDGVDFRLRKKKAEDKDYSVAKRQVNYKKEGNLASLLSQKDDALAALEGLCGQFSMRNFTPNKSQIDSPGVSQSQVGDLFLSPAKSIKLSQFLPQTPLLTQKDLKEVHANLEFSIGVDREDFALIEEIDPVSLTRYNNVDRDNIMDEEEDMAEEEFEKSLTVLRTQMVEPSQESLSQLDAVVNTCPPSQSKTIAFDEFGLGQESISSGDQIKSLSPNSQEKHLSTPPTSTKALSLPFSDSPSISVRSGDILELKGHPPTRNCFDMTATVRLHPSNLSSTAPVPWLGFASSVDPISHMSYARKFWQGSFVQQVVAPPSPNKVRKWVERKRRKDYLKINAQTKEDTERKHSSKDVLDFDSNSNSSKALRAKNPKRKRRVAFADDTHISSSTGCLVEEVSWTEGSQDFTQESATSSLSQDKNFDTSINTDKDLVASLHLGGIEQSPSHTNATTTQISPFTAHSDSPHRIDPLQGIGNQGGKIYVEGGGLKASGTADKCHLQSKLSMMSIEVHVQCRTGKAAVDNSTEIAMRPDPIRDSIFAVCYAYAIDPGGGEQIEIKERGCICIPTEKEITSFRDSEDAHNSSHLISKIGKTMGISSQMKLEVASTEKQLLLRISSIVQWKDPDALMSWDTQGGGLGYLIERGLAIGNNNNDNGNANNITKVDMVRLLGRTPKLIPQRREVTNGLAHLPESKATKQFTGSALGAEWDDRVGAGAGPSSIVS